MTMKVSTTSFFAALLFALFPPAIICQDAATVEANRAKQERERRDRSLREAVAVSKPSDEKDWLSQFLFTLPAGGTAEVGMNKTMYKADPSKNNLLDQLNFEFSFAKGGGRTADPRFLNVGLNFRNILLGTKRNRALKSLRASAPSTLLPSADAGNFRKTAARVVSELEENYKPEWFLNYAGVHFETDLKKFRPGAVNNLLFASSVEVRSRFIPISKHCRESSSTDSTDVSDSQCQHGPFFWSYRFVPVGLEIGKNLHNNDNKTLQGSLVSRLKSNANLQLFYRSPCRYDMWFAGILLEGDLTDRYLFKRETQFDRVTGLSNLLASPHQYALQLELKIITGLKLPDELGVLIKPLKKLNLPTLGRRPALTFSYRRGGVPPVYAFNNRFRIGLTFETLDADNSRDLGHLLPPR